MPTKQSTAGFADEVNEYVNRILNNKPLGKKYSRHVEQTGRPLVLNRRLLDRHLKENPIDLDGLLALRWLDEQQTGRGNLFWRYADSVRATRRKGKPPPSRFNETVRALLIGVVLAYANIAGISFTKARKEVVVRCELGTVGITADILKAWESELRKAKDPLPDIHASELMRRGYDKDRLLHLIRNWFVQFLDSIR